MPWLNLTRVLSLGCITVYRDRSSGAFYVRYKGNKKLKRLSLWKKRKKEEKKIDKSFKQSSEAYSNSSAPKQKNSVGK